jgi:hypothetical protein
VVTRRIQATSAADEVAAANLGDQRRTKRLRLITAQLEAEPAKSFPRVFGEAELEALYRFINNSSFGAADIVAPHIQATIARALSAGTVLAVHDTTPVEFDAPREDLGPTTGQHRYGFIAHATLLINEQDGMPLGVAHLETLTRSGKKSVQRKQGQRNRVQAEDESRESLRWLRGVDAIEMSRKGGFEVIHVTDAEGDFFELLGKLRAHSARFVIRSGQLDRTVTQDDWTGPLRSFVDAIVPQIWRDVELSPRKHPKGRGSTSRRRHAERAGRIARLAIGKTRITVGKSKYSNVEAPPFEVTVVRAWEPEPPPGEEPTEWVLLTTEVSSSDADLERVVDIYRKRWMIEEYFKALKSGCSLEKRQVESYDALCKVLALFMPIAYRLLLLRGLERIDSNAKATQVFSKIDLELLARAPANSRHPPPRTIADALLYLARLGGHIRNNGRPGWQTLSWGYEKLLLLRIGWEMATSARA